MNGHKYILEPYKGMNTRYFCPQCNKKEFTRYVDTQTGKYISSIVGKCNRGNKCGYNYSPRQYFKDNYFDISPQVVFRPTFQEKPVSLISFEIFKSSLGEPNNFIKYLFDLFPPDVVNGLVSRYFIGTSKHWSGSTVFWQIDTQGRIRTGKIMLYNPDTGKRVKEPYDYITWIHAAHKLNNFNLKQCFFGEHLLQESGKPVALVESEKTAIISSVYFPQLVWIAAGSLNNINPEKCQVLRSRNVTLFPDCKGFKKWYQRAKEMNFNCSDLLECKATPHEHAQGFDLVDYLIRYDFREFILPESTPPPGPVMDINTQKIVSNEKIDKPGFNQKRENWLPEIHDLESYFKATLLPSEPIQLNQWTKIIDISKFINSELSICKGQNGNPRYKSYLERLQELKLLLSKN